MVGGTNITDSRHYIDDSHRTIISDWRDLMTERHRTRLWLSTGSARRLGSAGLPGISVPDVHNGLGSGGEVLDVS
jgi:hypothetical protein